MERPACELGYTFDQIERIVGDRIDEFNHFMRGQTGSICEGKRYNYATKEYEPTGCGPHGPVVYSSDLARFLAGLPVID